MSYPDIPFCCRHLALSLKRQTHNRLVSVYICHMHSTIDYDLYCMLDGAYIIVLVS